MAILPPQALQVLRWASVAEWKALYTQHYKYESGPRDSDPTDYYHESESYDHTADGQLLQRSPFSWSGSGHTSFFSDFTRKKTVKDSADDAGFSLLTRANGTNAHHVSVGWPSRWGVPSEELLRVMRAGGTPTEKDEIAMRFRPVKGTERFQPADSRMEDPYFNEGNYGEVVLVEPLRLGAGLKIDHTFPAGGYADATIQLTANRLGSLLWWDGAALNLIDLEAGDIKTSHRAFSGIPGTTASLSGQRSKNKGPTPEGLYYIDQRETRSLDKADSAWDWIKWVAKEGSWGTVYTQLHPVADTETYGRGQFFIHGGARPGSRGCVDLVGLNTKFHDWFSSRYVEPELNVDPLDALWPSGFIGELVLVAYVPIAKKTPRTHDQQMSCPDDLAHRYCTETMNCSRNRLYEGPESVYPSERDALLRTILKELRG